MDNGELYYPRWAQLKDLVTKHIITPYQKRQEKKQEEKNKQREELYKETTKTIHRDSNGKYYWILPGPFGMKTRLYHEPDNETIRRYEEQEKQKATRRQTERRVHWSKDGNTPSPENHNDKEEEELRRRTIAVKQRLEQARTTLEKLLEETTPLDPHSNDQRLDRDRKFDLHSNDQKLDQDRKLDPHSNDQRLDPDSKLDHHSSSQGKQLPGGYL